MTGRWGRVILAYGVLAVLVAEYRLVEQKPVPPPETLPARPHFVGVDASALREVRLSRGDVSVVSRRENAQWAVVEPRGATIPPDLIGAFASALAESEEIARLDGTNDAAFGFGDGATRVELRSDGGEPVVLTIGGTNPPGTAVYARRQGASDVVLIGRNIRYYEDLIFQALTADRVPAADTTTPVG
jgi:hypothetical protein